MKKRKIIYTTKKALPDVAIRIHGELYNEVKAICKKEKKTLSEVVKDLLDARKNNTI